VFQSFAFVLAEGAVKLGVVSSQDRTASARIDPGLAAEFGQRVLALGPDLAPPKGEIFQLRKM
jgi:hypothetical protein